VPMLLGDADAYMVDRRVEKGTLSGSKERREPLFEQGYTIPLYNNLDCNNTERHLTN
jgi:hypothetical protein